MEALIQSGDVDALVALAASADPGLAKAARKGLHLLRSRGVATPDVPARAGREAPGPRERPTGDEWPSLATSSDGSGERLVWLMRGHSEGPNVFQARIHEIQGLLDFDSAHWSHRQMRSMSRDLLSMDELPCAQIPTDYAHWLIEEAWERTSAARRAPPPGFVRARADLRAAPRRYNEHPAPAEVAAGLAGEAEMTELFGATVCSGWYPEAEVLERFALRVDEIATSRLLVNDAQRSEQEQVAVRRAVSEYFTAECRARYARRLLDAAYILLRARGPEGRLAGTLRAAADALADAERDVEQQPFALGLFARCLRPKDDDHVDRSSARLVRDASSGLLLPTPRS